MGPGRRGPRKRLYQGQFCWVLDWEKAQASLMAARLKALHHRRAPKGTTGKAWDHGDAGVHSCSRTPSRSQSGRPRRSGKARDVVTNPREGGPARARGGTPPPVAAAAAGYGRAASRAWRSISARCRFRSTLARTAAGSCAGSSAAAGSGDVCFSSAVAIANTVRRARVSRTAEPQVPGPTPTTRPSEKNYACTVEECWRKRRRWERQCACAAKEWWRKRW